MGREKHDSVHVETRVMSKINLKTETACHGSTETQERERESSGVNGSTVNSTAWNLALTAPKRRDSATPMLASFSVVDVEEVPVFEKLWPC